MRDQPGPRNSRDFLASLLEASPLAIICIDPHGMVRFWNEAAEAIFAYRSAEVVERPLPIVPSGQEAAYARLFEAALGGQRWHHIRLPWRRKDGSLVQVSVSAAPLYNKSGDIDGVVYAVEDISERVQLEESLRQAQKMEAIGQLTGGVAHDFNNLLGIVTMNLDLLRDQVGEESEGMELIDSAQGAVHRGAELTHQLLAFSRRQPLSPKSVDLNDVVPQMVRMLRRTLGDNIDVATSAEGQLWSAHVDPGQLENAILNLAINARDAMPDGGRLVVEMANARFDQEAASAANVEPGCYVRVTVRDSGKGMPPDLLARVFEPFFTTKPEGQGTGLGLSMVYGFVKQSKGHVDIASETGRGTAVMLYLPRAEAPDPAESAETRGLMPHADAGETVLVVEDDAAVRQGTVKILNALGYDTREAGSGRDALAALETGESINLVITDVVMPGDISGLDLGHEIAARWPDLPVLYTSGYSEALSVAAERRKLVLTKPFRKSDLAMAIKAALHGQD